MKNRRLIKKYSDALVAGISTEKEFSKIKSDLDRLDDIMNREADFRLGLQSPILPFRQKTELVESVCGKLTFSEKGKRFLLTLIEEYRLPLFAGIVEQLDLSWYEKNGITKLTVFSAVKLKYGQEKALHRQLERVFKKPIHLDLKVDPGLIAGLKIQHGQIFYDFSMEGNLQRLKSKIEEGETDAGQG